MATSVVARRKDTILVIQLDDPSGCPRLERKVLAQLSEQFEAAASSADVRGVVITGTESAFAAGADLSEVAGLSAVDALSFSALGQALMRRVESLHKPVVAAIRGWCLGGGFDLAMACHLRVAATDAIFGHPGGSLGLMTGWGGTARLPRIVGRARAAEMLITGETISAAQAYAWGLVNRLVAPPDALSTAIVLAHDSAGHASAAP